MTETHASRPLPAASPSLLRPALALAGATLFWTGNFTVGRAVSGVIEPLTLNFFRWLLALAVFTPFVIVAVRRDWDALWRARAWVFGAGLTGVAVFQTLVYYGVAGHAGAERGADHQHHTGDHFVFQRHFDADLAAAAAAPRLAGVVRRRGDSDRAWRCGAAPRA